MGNPSGPDHPQYNRTEVLCDTCGKKIQKWPSRIREHNFCSRSCREIWQKTSGYTRGEKSATWMGGYIDYRGPNWKEQRELALERDCYICQRCGVNKGLQVHHKIPYQVFSNNQDANQLDNLETLCTSCHIVAEWEYRQVHPNDQRVIPQSARIHICENCGTEYQAKGHKSKRCDDCWQRTCLKCGEVFRPRLWHETNKYCSRECAGTSKPIPSALGNS